MSKATTRYFMRTFQRCVVSIFMLALANLAVSQGDAPRQMDIRRQPPLWSSKPDIPAFERMENQRLAAAQKAIAQITGVAGSRTIANTLAPYDEANRQLNAAQYFSTVMEAVHPDAKFRDHATAMTRKVHAAATDLSLNREVYLALFKLDLADADTVTHYYVNRQLLEYRLGGVDRDDTTRARLKQLNDQLTSQQSAFDRNISDDQKTIQLTGSQGLDGLPKDFIDRHKPNQDGTITLSTDYADYYPSMKFAKSDALRRELMLAFQTRAYPKNRDVFMDILKSRYEIAQLLGYKSWADYDAADKMIGSGAGIADLIRHLNQSVRPTAAREFEMLLAEKRKANPAAIDVGMHEKSYYQELLRRAQFDFDSQSVRPYFPFAQVQQGILDTAATLFHVSFQRERNVPAWFPSVETWDVIDQGRIIGRFYLDMHSRPGKYTHDEMAPVLDGVFGKQLPEAVLICNFPNPSATDPGLMEYDDVEAFFHEFGHLMHMILGGQQPWAGISGISMEADFVEAPSQMLENWLRSPQVLASFARHYQTGEPIPAELVGRMNRAAAFGRASFVSLQNSHTALSYDVHKGAPQEVDLETIARDDDLKYADFTPLPGTREFASFGHLSGYSSRYYTYMFDLVIAQDFFSQFDSANLLTDSTAMRYRKTVLEPGGSMSANDLVKGFLGRPQNMGAFEKWLGQEFETK